MIYGYGLVGDAYGGKLRSFNAANMYCSIMSSGQRYKELLADRRKDVTNDLISGFQLPS
ncbi:hypothetical protein [Nostoc sp.]|uniref:hypothetical protein n=1 Tax=Nostoc sp. TaxID=1180 RepID=UPI002FFBFFD9